ncbi:MAG TPA: hypothetical protein VF469_17340 [Kofleriaceae bacterium]
MESGLSLAQCSDATIAPPGGIRPEAVWGMDLVSVVAFLFFLALLPLSSMLYVAGVGASFVGLAAIPWPRTPSIVFPEDIFDPVLRETYRAILAARGQLERAVEDAPGLKRCAASLNKRCADAVRLCARFALVANRLHVYLTANEASRIATEIAQLRSKATTTRDASAARDLGKAAAAYERQLATCAELVQTRDRIRARLDLVLASLRSFIAAVVKQQATEDEQLALAGESLSEQVDEVQGELAVLESALELGAAD